MIIKRLKKIAMPARLGEIDGIVHPMPVLLTEEAKQDYPIYSATKVREMVDQDDFLHFVYCELGKGENALIQIYSSFILESAEYCKKYNLKKEAANNYDSISEEHKGGNCFGDAFNYIFNEGVIGGNNNLILVHAIICPIMGPLAGITFGHAWIEDGDKVIDTSRNNEIMDKHSYYLLGGLMNLPTGEFNKDTKITAKEENMHRYTVQEAKKMVLEHEMYGPWEESFDEYVLDDKVDHDGLDQHQ